jgi:hypothetical protein
MDELMSHSEEPNRDASGEGQGQAESQRGVPRAWAIPAVLAALSLGSLILFTGNFFKFSSILLVCPVMFVLGVNIWRKGGTYSLLSFKDLFESPGYSMNSGEVAIWMGAMCVSGLLFVAALGAMVVGTEDAPGEFTYKGQGLNKWKQTLDDAHPGTRREAIEAIYSIAMTDGHELDEQNKDKIPFVHKHRDPSDEALLLVKHLDNERDLENRLYCAITLINLSSLRAGHLSVDEDAKRAGQSVLLSEVEQGNANSVCLALLEHYDETVRATDSYLFHLVNDNLQNGEQWHFDAAFDLLQAYNAIRPGFISHIIPNTDMTYWEYVALIANDPDRPLSDQQKKILLLESELARRNGIN